MKPPVPALRSLAGRLLEHETGTHPGAAEVAGGADAVCRKLSRQLEPLIGPMGFQVMLARALHLAQSEFPLLEGVRSGAAPDGWLEGLGERVRGRGPAEVRATVTAVFAGFLGLVGYFIGDELTVRIVSRAWPDLPSGTVGPAFEGEAV